MAWKARRARSTRMGGTGLVLDFALHAALERLFWILLLREIRAVI